jgi:hypothetical protein
VRKAKEPKPEGEAGAPRPRLHKYADELIITVLKPGSKARAAKLRFDEYVTGMTVGEYVKKIEEKYKRTAGQTQADLRWDAVDHDFIHIGPTVIDVPPPPPPAPKPTPAPTTTPPAAA